MDRPPLPRTKVWNERRQLSKHAQAKLIEIDCGFSEFEASLPGAEIIEERIGLTGVAELVLVVHWKRPLHVVVVELREAGLDFLVTIYEPVRSQWKSGYRRRRQ